MSGSVSGTSRQRRQREVATTDQHIAGILAPRDGRDDQSGCQLGGNVLHRVHGAVDALGCQRFLNLLDENALAADGAEWGVEETISGGLDRDQLDRQIGIMPLQLGLHPP